MIIGKGLIAKAFHEFDKKESIIIFASGVSNSKEKDELKYKREFSLLKSTISSNPSAKIVYFSTLSILDSSMIDSRYVKHKISIENYIIKNVQNYLILRVSNIIGYSKNPNTILNYLVFAVKKGTKITVWKNAERNLIDVDDVFSIVKELLTYNKCGIVNIGTNTNFLVPDILKTVESLFNKKVNAEFIEKGNKLKFDLNTIANQLVVIEKKKGVGETYLINLIKKYYS